MHSPFHRRPRRRAGGAAVLAAVLAATAGAAPTAATAQNPIDDYREGVRVGRSVFLSLGDGRRGPMYREDGRTEAEDGYPLKRNTTFIVKQERGLILLMDFLNPLRYNVSVSETSLAESNYATVAKFASSVAELGRTLKVSDAPQNPVDQVTKGSTSYALGGSTDRLTPKTSQAEAAVIAQASGGSTELGTKRVAFLAPAAIGRVNAAGAYGQEKLVAETQRRADSAVQNFAFPVVASPDLVLWTLLASEPSRLACLASQPGATTTLLDRMGDADALVYAGQAADVDRPAQRYARVAGGLVATLLAPDDLPGFRAALDSARRAGRTLDRYDRRTDDAMSAVAAAARSFRDQMRDTTALCRNFVSYTDGVVANFQNAAAGLLDGRRAAVKGVRGVLEDLAGATASYATPNAYNAYRIATVEVPAGTMKDVRIVVRRRTVDSSGGRLTLADGAADTMELRVRRRQSVITEFSAGVAYLANVAYPRFGTRIVGGAPKVDIADPEAQRQTVVGMLNLYFPKVLGPVVPGFQLGAGAGRNYPMLMAGGVVRSLAGTPFALSGGVALPWYQELKTLKDGQAVTGTSDVESDLRFRLGRGSFYAALQYSF